MKTDKPFHSPVFILNPIAGDGKKQRYQKAIQAFCKAHGLSYEILTSQAPGHAYDLAKKWKGKGADLIMAVGGDGTVNEIGRALQFSDTPLGIIPAGSGNGLARALGISMKPEKALHQAWTGKTEAIDFGVINEHPFFCTAGVGFDAHVGAIFAQKQTRGFWTYLSTTLQEYKGYTPLQYKIETETKSWEENAFVVTLANANQYGNNAIIAPSADLSDGLLELCRIAPFRKREILKLGWQLFTYKLEHNALLSYDKVKVLKITPEQPVAFHYDGEPSPEKVRTLEVSIKEKGLLVRKPS